MGSCHVQGNVLLRAVIAASPIDNAFTSAKVIFPAAFATPVTGVFKDDAKLADMQFQSWPGIGAANGFFEGTTGNWRGRIVFPRGNADWERYMEMNGTFVPYSAASQEAKAAC